MGTSYFYIIIFFTVSTYRRIGAVFFVNVFLKIEKRILRFYPQMFSEKTLKEDKSVMTNNVQTVPIHEKLALTIREAA